jgi:hypothetical protein
MVIKLGSRFIRNRLYPNFNGHTLQVPISEQDAAILEGDDTDARQELTNRLVQPNNVKNFYLTPIGAKLVGMIANRTVSIAIPNAEIHEVPN